MAPINPFTSQREQTESSLAEQKRLVRAAQANQGILMRKSIATQIRLIRSKRYSRYGQLNIAYNYAILIATMNLFETYHQRKYIEMRKTQARYYRLRSLERRWRPNTLQ